MHVLEMSSKCSLNHFPHDLSILLLCAAMIPVWFNPANYSVKEGVDGNAVITLEAGGHNFDFTVIVNSQDETAFSEF